jgi:hypothetical protein
MSIKEKDLYELVINEIKSYGIKVTHKKLSESEGLCHYDEGKITLSSKNKNTLIGCVFAYHELAHYIDYKNNKFPEFYNNSYLTNKKYSLKQKEKIILDAEWNCYLFAKNKLKKYNILKNYDDLILNKRWIKKHILPLWVEYYLGSQKK